MTLLMKAGGAVLIAAAGVLAGAGAAREYTLRVREIEDMMRALSRMRAEIELRLTPMEDIFRELSGDGGACASFFAVLADALAGDEQGTLPELWERTAARLLRPSRARDILTALGASLGRYDAAEECRAIDAALERLGAERADVDAERRIRAPLSLRLGTAAGIALAVLFL